MALFAHLFMKMMEVRRKGRVKGHRLHVRRKIMESEEIRGLIHKKASED